MTDDRIKSAYELAMERIDKMGEATEEEQMRWKLVPDGEKLAVSYFENKVDLAEGFAGYKKKEQGCVAEGIQKVLLSHINLPKNETIIRESTQALEGFAVIKEDKESLQQLADSIGGLFDHYKVHGEQQRQQAVQSLKEQFKQKMQQAAREQGNNINVDDVDPEIMPQFIEEKRRMMAHLDLQYIKHLDAYKGQIAALK
jgi:hypothetical protein